MKRTPVILSPDQLPPMFAPLVTNTAVYDSSCSPAARVWFLDRDGGLFLKKSPKGTLETEAALTRFYHSKGLGAEVLAYQSLEEDWLLTARIPGEDCLDLQYLDDPARLCDTTGELLRMLHSIDPAGCPVPDRTKVYLDHARQNYEAGRYDMELFPDNWGYDTPEAAWAVLERDGHLLKSDTLLHGDYCLPNIILKDWRLGGFIDLDTGGVGDRHVDLFWGIWSLQFNLKTHRYRERFLDVYGRENVQEELLRVVAAAEVFG